MQFCKETENAEYSLGSLFSVGAASIIKTPSMEDMPMVEENRKFFCSELIAKAYKECNISQ